MTIIVQRDPRNRVVCINIEGDTGYSRSSCWDHTGEGARYQTVILYPDLPSGSYAAQARLTRALAGGKSEIEQTPTVQFRLTGFGDEPGEP